ncbi:hypothetical protein ABVK25_006098 [Lepraria finkii]|uniref:Protein kinase domain-containing protein n=1 Tax=Lepraria finkii TaxID=1340010 RepID=A0ABR4B8M4_9LECA
MDGLQTPVSQNKQRWLPLTSPPTTPAFLPAKRPALAELPALPMGQRPQPITLKTTPGFIPRLSENEPLTPPATPATPRTKQASMSADGIESICSIGVNLRAKPADILEFKAKKAKETAVYGPNTEPKPYTNRYTLHEELGYGIWSTVYRASETPEPIETTTKLPSSPPESPLSRSIPDCKKTLAVKQPHRRDAHKILENEARILTFLHAHAEASNYLVPFHGWDVASHSLILSAIPLNLETHAKSARKAPLTTKTMFDPVIGAAEWAHLAENLISGLAFLHGHGCVHGDIKPANILLQPYDDSKYAPLYCDFSSSHILSSTTPTKPEEVSAVTTDYISPSSSPPSTTARTTTSAR